MNEQAMNEQAMNEVKGAHDVRGNYDADAVARGEQRAMAGMLITFECPQAMLETFYAMTPATTDEEVDANAAVSAKLLADYMRDSVEERPVHVHALMCATVGAEHDPEEVASHLMRDLAHNVACATSSNPIEQLLAALAEKE